MLVARYGLPYQGSKSRIAEWVVEQLPASHTLVDLFAGGCAVTHAALLSGKWDNIIMNDICDAPSIFLRAIHGEFKDYSYVPTREEFFASDDSVVKLLYSFSNNKKHYLWGSRFEPVKVAASKMLSMPTLNERRLWYRRFCTELHKFLLTGDVVDKLSRERVLLSHGVRELQGLESLERLEGLERLQGLERLERLQGLESLERLQGLESLERLQGDYRDVVIPDGATVYADPPYANTDKTAYNGFCHSDFETWLSEVPYPVYVSEYVPPKGCVAIASRERMCSLSATKTNKTIELICVQERFANDGGL